MTESSVCANPQCGHEGEFHDDQTGICLATGCRCLRFWLEDDEFEEADDELTDLDFDHGL